MIIIDGNNMLHRIADRVGSGIHPARELYGRFNSPPDTTIIVWDGPYANQRRKEIYPKYKKTRRPKEESKHVFFDIAKGVLRFAPVIQVEIPGWEADDIIGTLVNHYHPKGHNITVETNDGDYWQHKDKCHLPLVTKKWHKFTADECLLYKALVGEAKDNVTGVSGFGQISWDAMNWTAKNNLINIIKNDGTYEDFCNAMQWPHRATPSPARFEDFKLCWKLNESWEVPMEEIDKHMKACTSNVNAAEIFMEGYLI